jgi:hypothetical protein
MTDELVPLLDKMAPLLGPDVTGMFKLMGMAEEEIAYAIKMDPLNEIKIHDSFCLLCPRMVLFGGRHPDLYRHHVRELIARHVAGEDTRPGTKAEVLATLSKTSLMANLIPSAHLLMQNLMAEIFPSYEQPDGWEPQEEIPGSVDDALEKCRRQCFEPQRTRDQKRRSTNG